VLGGVKISLVVTCKDVRSPFPPNNGIFHFQQYYYTTNSVLPAGSGIRACSSPHTFRRLLKTPLFSSGRQFPLAAHTSSPDSAFGRHCAL